MYPMKRVSERGERGKGKFNRITWDRALTEISQKTVFIRGTCGPQAMVDQSYAGVPHGVLHKSDQIAGLLGRFIGMAGWRTSNWSRGRAWISCQPRRAMCFAGTCERARPGHGKPDRQSPHPGKRKPVKSELCEPGVPDMQMGFVHHDVDCIGRRKCEAARPFGAPPFDVVENVVKKCKR